MKPTLRVTERAASHLNELLATRAESPTQCLRLVAAGGLAAIMLDWVQEKDKVVEVKGTPLLVVDHSLASVLDGATLDYADTSVGPQLTLVKGGRLGQP